MITDEWTMNLLSWEALRFILHLDLRWWTWGSGWVTRASTLLARACPLRIRVHERVRVMRERVLAFYGGQAV